MDEQISEISNFLARMRDAAEDALRQRRGDRVEVAVAAPIAPAPPPMSLAQAVWLNVDEAVRYLGLPSRRALYQCIRRGHVAVHRMGRSLRFLRSELDEALRQR
jgi:excisionase family DNA binding protein